MIYTKPCNKENYGSKRKNTDYIVIHYTSNKGDTAENNAVYFAREALKNPASAHFFVDENEIWSSVPIDSIAYHCGAKRYKHKSCRNSNSLGIEICMNDKSGNIRYKSINNACELVKRLMSEYKIPISHILRHYDITGKHCPAPMVDNIDLWNDFLNSLNDADKEDEMKIYKYVKDMPEWARESAVKAIKKGIVAMDSEGAVSIYETNLQSLVWLDRAGLFD